jgi:hypothetical protein
MAIKVALLAGPFIAAMTLVSVLESTEANPALAVALLALVAVIGGAAIGAFWPVPSDPPSWTKRVRKSSPRS